MFESNWTSVKEYIKKANLVDIDYGLQLFSMDRSKAIKMYIEYMQQPNRDQCLDDRVKIRKSNREVREYLYQLGIDHSSTL